MLATLPVVVIVSQKGQSIDILSRGDHPALNVESRCISENVGVLKSEPWVWVDAILSKGHKARPPGVVHAQCRFNDSLGTIYLTERRWLGETRENSYGVFKYSNGKWEHLRTGTRQLPLCAESARPKADTH